MLRGEDLHGHLSCTKRRRWRRYTDCHRYGSTNIEAKLYKYPCHAAQSTQSTLCSRNARHIQICSISLNALYTLSRLHCAPGSLQFRTGGAKVRLVTAEEIFTSYTAPVTHAPEDAALIVKVDRTIELCHITLVHNKDAIIPGYC